MSTLRIHPLEHAERQTALPLSERGSSLWRQEWDYADGFIASTFLSDAPARDRHATAESPTR
jgi:hypothetical protein